MIESAASADAFEQAVSDLLAELHTSHLGFFHGSARRASSRAALSATYLEDETAYSVLRYRPALITHGTARFSKEHPSSQIKPADLIGMTGGSEEIGSSITQSNRFPKNRNPKAS